LQPPQQKLQLKQQLENNLQYSLLNLSNQPPLRGLLNLSNQPPLHGLLNPSNQPPLHGLLNPSNYSPPLAGPQPLPNLLRPLNQTQAPPSPLSSQAHSLSHMLNRLPALHPVNRKSNQLSSLKRTTVC
jgi:hypothetical protein